ncbi:hypothetical protein HELRODRAFT_185698 [Helobdella robusta]|uniref:Uncharacterized protein n=1 Tax=Helobdella robusta TaxID=6412 RepID=T1FN59_HELRO|nr:hypothetical protein HELRODRAFT_185698 [Helobdella robusta]ESO01654.1 hypothetical protein HELRODRAFT_185698 [Helobdella robusta]
MSIPLENNTASSSSSCKGSRTTCPNLSNYDVSVGTTNNSNNNTNSNNTNCGNKTAELMLKTVILIGGPSKGTRFRPLSLDLPKPLFPIAGFPMIYHHIEATSKLPNMKEILLVGSYQSSKHFSYFIASMQQQFKIVVRYLQEFETLGTAGGLFHFRDQILNGNPDAIFVMNADVCGEFPLKEMLDFHKTCSPDGRQFTILATEATRQQSLNYGCIVENEKHQVLHYVEKPHTFVSTLISCGIYLFSTAIFEHISVTFKEMNEEISFDIEDSCRVNCSVIRLEQDIFSKRLPQTGKFFVYQTNNFWSQVKSASATIYANRHYLAIYSRTHPERLAPPNKMGPLIIGDVFIDPGAFVHPTAVLGPNVTVSKGANVGPGARVRESIILEGAVLKDHCCILYSIIGWKSVVGEWARIEGTPMDPNPNKPFAKLDSWDLFQEDGRLHPSITVIGSNVHIPAEVVVLNSIVLPDKDLDRSFKNQIIL